jgi:hypothetical protein
MRNIRTVALGLAIASFLMLEFLAQAIRFLTSTSGFGFAQAIRALSPELADLAGLQILPGAMLILFFVAAGLLIASFIIPFIEEAIEAAAAMSSGLMRLVGRLVKKLLPAPRG